MFEDFSRDGIVVFELFFIEFSSICHIFGFWGGDLNIFIYLLVKS
jgi:hypothetical protein